MHRNVRAVAAKQQSSSIGPASILTGSTTRGSTLLSNSGLLRNVNADKSAQFFASTCAEHRNLLALQADLEKTFGRGTFINISLTETMKKILKLERLSLQKWRDDNEERL